ncbi:MAG TPA: hypothetical protein VFQ50_02510, partial [Flavobacterium sp.]|nr:hypothetical protein [Flavobacterium sp.]
MFLRLINEGHITGMINMLRNSQCYLISLYLLKIISMQFSDKRHVTRWIIIIASFVIITLILWNTYSFFQIFKSEERVKMELWASAQKSLINADENTDIELVLNVFQNNTTIPVIVTTENDSIERMTNIDEESTQDPVKLQQFLKKLKGEN